MKITRKNSHQPLDGFSTVNHCHFSLIQRRKCMFLCRQLDVKEAKKVESHPQWEISDDDEEKDADDEDGSESDISDYDESDGD